MFGVFVLVGAAFFVGVVSWGFFESPGPCLPVGAGCFCWDCLFQCFLLESLILAQDERWRRA